MRRQIISLMAITAMAASAGCGSQGTSASSAGGPLPSDPVARVVYEFLDAVRRGDTETSSARLTPLALQRTSELDLNFSPPGSPTAKFRVGAVEMVDAEKAVVECMWTDQDADGVPRDEKITWALKLTDGEWRISGMAADMGEDQEPVVMDFENPSQLISQAPSATPSSAEPRQASQLQKDPFLNQPR